MSHRSIGRGCKYRHSFVDWNFLGYTVAVVLMLQVFKTLY